jgi:L-ascorbate metabolism protein UlaG (beta-lactamase superfamily)
MKFLRIIKRMTIGILAVVAVIAAIGLIYLQFPQFGQKPNGERLERIKQSPNYRDGQFQNISPSPVLVEGYSYTTVMYEYLFGRTPNLTPSAPIPNIKSDLKSLPKEQDLLVWFGHSSYLLQLDGTTFLVDPVLSGYASPSSLLTKAFEGSNVYQVEDLPQIDYLLISHDHYDHLDYETITKLKGKVGTVICGLGVGAHFEAWGYDPAKVIERDWWEEITFDKEVKVHLTPARHFSGRGIQPGKTLWTSYVIETPSKKIYVGGDSGYDTHFAAIGEKFGGFDLAIIENGQYDVAWRNIHVLPEDAIQASKDLNAKTVFPVHSGKFKLANHPWDEPYLRISELANTAGIPLVTPIIGQLVDLNDSTQTFPKWWEKVK